MQNAYDTSQPAEAIPEKPLISAIYFIWWKPRITIRRIVDTNPKYGVIILACLSGIARFLDQANERSLGDEMSLEWILLCAIFVGAIGGCFSLLLSSIFFKWTGSWFGGKATAQEIRAAVAWSSIPNVLTLVLYCLLILLSGKAWFISSTGQSNPLLLGAMILFLLPFGFLILGLRIFLLVKCLAEVHRFSAWKGLFTVITSSIIIVALLLLGRFVLSL